MQLWNMLCYWKVIFGLRASLLCTSGIILWYYVWALNERKFSKRAGVLDSNFRKSVVAVKLLPQSLCSLSHRFRDVTFCCPDKRTQLLSFKETWWHVTLWSTQLHMFGCPREGTGMFDNPAHVFRCWSSWTLKDQVWKWFCLCDSGKP